MSSAWMSETVAIICKELKTEWRGKVGLFNTAMFAISAVAIIGLATSIEKPSATLASAMLLIALLFSAVTGLSRTFLIEHDQRTSDLLQMIANPAPVYWGKLVFNFLLLSVESVGLIFLFVLFTNVVIADVTLFSACIFVGNMALCTAISICASLASKAKNRGAVVGVISLPALFPALLLGIAALRQALGAVSSTGWSAVAGLAGLSLLYLAVGPYLFAATWKE